MNEEAQEKLKKLNEIKGANHKFILETFIKNDVVVNKQGHFDTNGGFKAADLKNIDRFWADDMIVALMLDQRDRFKGKEPVRLATATETDDTPPHETG